MKISYLATWILSIAFFHIAAQADMKIERLSEEEGLSHRDAKQIIQDQNGFIWIATQDGLNRYDGYEFKVYPVAGEDFNYKILQSIQESRDGMIWIKPSYDEAVIIFNPNTKVARRAKYGADYFYPNQENIQIIYRSFYPFLSKTEELRRLYFSALAAKNEKEQNTLSRSQGVYGTKSIIVKNGDKELWVWHLGNSRNSKFHYARFEFHIKAWHFFDISNFLKVPIANSALPIDTQRRLWFPSFQKNPSQPFDYVQLPDSIPLQNWQSLRVDNHLNIWIFDKEFQLFRFDLKQRVLERIGKIESGKFEVYEDREGTIWVGTENGLLKIRRRKRLFENYLDSPFKLGQIPPIGNSIGNIIEAGDGLIFANNKHGQLFQINPRTQQTKILPVSKIFYLLSNSSDNYFIKFVAKNLYGKIDAKTLKVDMLELPVSTPLFSGDMTDKIVFSSFRKPILIIDTLSDKIWELKKQWKSNPYSSYWQKTKQLLWVNTEGRIETINLTDLSSEEVPLAGENEKIQVRGWLEKGDSLWLATFSGLKVLDTKSRRILKTYTTKDGLPHNTIYSIIDSDDHFWLGTHNGLCCFNPQTGEVKNFYVEDGLTHNEFNTNSVLRARDGKIWMGGLNGIDAFRPDVLAKIKQDTSLLFLTKFSKFNADNDSLYVFENIQNLNHQKFVIQACDQSFRFQFIINSLINPSQNRYFWYLEGHESAWAHANSQADAAYFNIPPGSYRLKIKAKDYRGIPARNELAIDIEVLQVWYKRWWARLLYVLLSIGAAFALYRYQLHRKLEQQETLRLKELDAVKTKLYTNISHEFRTPLTVILGMAEQLKAGSRQLASGRKLLVDFEKKLGMIKRNGQNLLHLINQMLDLSKLEMGQLSLNLIYDDVVMYIKYILESFHSLAEMKNIRLHFLSEVPVLKMDFDREKLLHVVSNLLSNAVKFTPEGGTIYVQLAVQKKQPENQKLPAENRLLLTVKDTGTGIPPDKLPHIFDRFYQADDSYTRQGEGTGIGLALAKELVNLMGGEVSVESEVGKGTKFEVLLPVRKNAPPAPAVPPVVAVKEESSPEQRFEKTASSKGKSATLLPEGAGDDYSQNLTGLGEAVENKPNQPLLLIIEDNPDVTEYIRSILQTTYGIIHAPDGATGIEKAIETIPDLILSDVMMPQKDGFEVVQTLKMDERTSHIPIILLTAKADVASKIEGLGRGADAYLAKPFNEKELHVRLEKLLELRRRLQERYSHMPFIVGSKSWHSFEMEDKFFQKFETIIQENLANPDFGMDQLSRELGMSRSQVYRKMKALTGISPTGFIRSFRLQNGRELLLTSQLTASEIAFKVGFSSLSYFSDSFFEEFGVRPSELRK